MTATFSQGYGFSYGEYTTADPEQIHFLLDAVSLMEIDSVSDMDVTDWYPYIFFECADGTSWGLHFDGHWLYLNGINYHLANDSTFWALFASLEAQYYNAE